MLRQALLDRYYHGDLLPGQPSDSKEDKDDTDGGKKQMTLPSATEMSLTVIQTKLDTEGASDLVVDLIVCSHSQKIFQDVLELGIALLQGGNTTVQVGGRVVATPQYRLGDGGNTIVQVRAGLPEKQWSGDSMVQVGWDQ